MTPLTRDQVLALIRAAVAAPSADNRHVVRFEHSGATIRMHVDRAAIAGAASHRVLFNELAFGAIIENLVLAAGDIGRVAMVRRNAPWDRDFVVADIEYEATSQGTPDPLRNAIFQRSTNRRLYNPRKRISAEILQHLAETAASIDHVRVHWVDDARARSRALGMILQAERERFRRQWLHSELFGAVRFDVGWRSQADEGLPPGALEIEPAFKPLFGALRRWGVQRAVNAMGGAQMLGWRAAWLPARTAPHLALLSVPRTDAPDFIAAGRALQRFWLAAASHSIAVQPLAASIALAAQSSEESLVPRAVAAPIRQHLDALAQGRCAAMIIRLGYAAEPTLRAGRRAPESYLIPASA